MGIVTGCAFEYSLLEPVPFVELKLRIDILVAHEAAFCGAGIEERGFWIGVYGVARCAVHSRLSVGAGEKPGIGFCVACDAFLCFFNGLIFGFKSKDIGSAALIHMRLSVAVTGGAALHSRMRIGWEGFGHAFMTCCTGFNVSVLIGWFGGGQKGRSTEGQADKANRSEKR